MSEKLELLPHNQEAVEEIENALKYSNRVCTVRATGTGKSYIALQLTKDYNDKTVLYFTSSSPNLSEYQDKLDKFVENNKNRVTTMLYASAKKTIEQQYDIIILDEMHRAGAKVTSVNLNELLEKNGNSYIIGMSATPIRYLDSKRNMAEELFNGNIVATYNITQAIYDGVLPEPDYISATLELTETDMNFANLIKSKSEVSVHSIQYAKSNIIKAENIGEFFTNTVFYPNGKYIIFTSSLKHTNEVCEHVKEWFEKLNKNISVTRFNSIEIPSEDERKRVLKKFCERKSEELELLVAIDLLNEGTHLENIDGSIMLRNTKSPNIYIQQLGRVLSVKKLKHRPQIIDVVSNISLLRNTKEIWDEEGIAIDRKTGEVVRPNYFIHEGMIDFVEEYEKYLKELSRDWDTWYQIGEDIFKKTGTINVKNNYITENNENFGSWLNYQRKLYRNDSLSADKVLKLENLGIIWDVYDNHNKNEMFISVIRAYYQEFGNLDVKTNETYMYEGVQYPLGRWLSESKTAYKNGKLDKSIQEELDKCNFRWKTQFSKSEYKKICEYISKENKGIIDISSSHIVMWEGKPAHVGGFLYKLKKKLDKGLLPQEDYEYFSKLGVNWDGLVKNKHPDDSWGTNFKNLQKLCNEGYVIYRGTGTSTVKALPQNMKDWLNVQYKNYNNHTLSDDKIKKLESVGVLWNADDRKAAMKNTKGKTWYEYIEVLQYCKQNNIPINTKTIVEFDGKKVNIGTWIAGRKKQLKKGLLTDEQIKVLANYIDVKDKWEVKYDELKTFAEIHGGLYNTSLRKYSANLFAWLQLQYKNYNIGKLTEEQVQKLHYIGVIWNEEAREKLNTSVKDLRTTKGANSKS